MKGRFITGLLHKIYLGVPSNWQLSVVYTAIRLGKYVGLIIKLKYKEMCHAFT